MCPTLVPFSVSKHRPSRGPLQSGPPAERRRDADPPPKATLFCPTCSHSDHVAGEWDVGEVGGGEDRGTGRDQYESGAADGCETAARTGRTPAPGGHLSCPGCGTIVTGGSPEDRAPAPGLTPAQLAVRTGLALSPVLWVAGVRHWWSMTEPLVGPRTTGAEDR
jgi:hypothetical protein